MTTMTEPHYAAPRQQFERETTEHEMTVLHDDGVYRHLRFAKPGTSIWSFDLITWPGHLAIAGDIGAGWTFSREEDMIRFFSSARKLDINPSYWWEKMPSHQRSAAQVYDPELLRQHAHETISEWVIDHEDDAICDAEIARAIAEFDEGWRWLEGVEADQARYVRDFTFADKAGETHQFYDTWEWDTLAFDHHFLLACFAIAHGVRTYLAAKAAESDR